MNREATRAPKRSRLDFAETEKQFARRMNEPPEFKFIPLKSAARYRVEKPKAALRFKHVDNITVLVDSDFAGDPVSRKSTTGLLAQTGNHSEIWINVLEFDSIDRWRNGVLRSGERRSRWTMFKIYVPSVYQNLGIPMTNERQSDSSTANYLTDRLGAGQRTKQIHTRYFWTQERVQDGEVVSRRLRRCWKKQSLCFRCRIPLQDEWIAVRNTRDQT